MDPLAEKSAGTEQFPTTLFFADDASLEVPDGSEIGTYCTINELGKKLLTAAAKGSVSEIRLLMAKGAPFSADWLGTSPLHLAASNNHLEVCNVLVRAGMTKDARTKVDRTPLHMAAYEGHAAIVECLLNLGADCDAKDLLNMTALHWAAQNGHADVAQCLIRHGASTDLVNNFNLKPIDIAMQMKRMDIVDIIRLAIRDPSEAAKNLTLELLSENSGNSYDTPIVHVPHPDLIMDSKSDAIISPIPMIETVLLDDQNFGSFSSSNEEVEQNPEESDSQRTAIKFLEDHGISIMPLDEGCILNTVMEAGHSVVLTEAGKQALNSIKPGEVNVKYVKPQPVAPVVKPKKIITMTSDQFMLMTQNGGINGPKNILKQLNGKMVNTSKVTSNRIVMKKNKFMRISQPCLVEEQTMPKPIKVEKIDSSMDVSCLLEQLQKAYCLVDSYKSRLTKAESENAKLKQQIKQLTEQLQMEEVIDVHT